MDDGLILERNIRAPAMNVYRAFTDAKEWCSWCCDEAQVEPQLGGQLYIVTPGYEARGEYTILEPEQLVAFTWLEKDEPPTQIEVRLDEQSEITRLLFTVRGIGESLTGEFVDFLERVWGRALDNLKRVLESSSTTGSSEN